MPSNVMLTYDTASVDTVALKQVLLPITSFDASEADSLKSKVLELQRQVVKARLHKNKKIPICALTLALILPSAGNKL